MSKTEEEKIKRSRTVRKKVSPKRERSRVTRKAPTKTSKTTGLSFSSYYKKLILVSVIGILMIGGVSMYIGKTDSGIIDVSAIIVERAAREKAKGNIAESSKIKAVNAPASNKKVLPNGGLIGRGDKNTEQQVLEQKKKYKQTKISTATTTASSTSGAKNATSTEELLNSVASSTETTEIVTPPIDTL